MRADAKFEAFLRARIEDAMRHDRDPTRAALSAFEEYDANRIPVVRQLLDALKHVEIHRGVETTYQFTFTQGLEEEVIELNHEAAAEGPKLFAQEWLRAFNRPLQFPKGAWVEFLDAALNDEARVTLTEGREEASDEEIAVEDWIVRTMRFSKPTLDIHESLREEDCLYWDDETSTVLIRSERINEWLKRNAHKIPLTRFAHLLKTRGIIVQTSVQKKIPAKGEEKAMNLRMWRLRPDALGFAKPLPPAVVGLPDDVPAGLDGALEGAR